MNKSLDTGREIWYNVLMTKTATPTQANRGLLPVGTVLPSGARIIEVSLTAYKCSNVSRGRTAGWLSFDQVHGRPAPATPLLTLG